MNAVQLAELLLSYMPMDHKKLQKIAYYAQAWHYTLYDEELVDDVFEAWVHGPVCPTIYHEYKGYGWNDIPKTTKQITAELKDFLDMIIDAFGKYTGDQLEYMTHLEEPWKNARGNLRPWEASNTTISLDSMKDFYSKLKEESQTE